MKHHVARGLSHRLASPTPLTGSDKFGNVRVLSALVPRVDATITKRCMSSHAKFSNFSVHSATIIAPFMTYSQ